MAKKRIPRKRRASTRRKRRVSGLSPAVVSGTRRKKTTRRKRRVSGTGTVTGNKMMDAFLGVGLGQVISIGVNALASKIPGVSIDARIVAGVKVLGGGAAAAQGMKKNNMLISGMGLSLLGSGINEAAKEFGVIQGITDIMSGNGGGSDEMLIQLNGLDESSDQPGVVGRDENDISLISGSDDNMPDVIS